MVTVAGGAQKPVSDLRPGDLVLASSGSDGGGELVFSEVLTFLDRDPETPRLFYSLRTESGAELRLTAAHLLFVSEGNCSEGAEPTRGALRTAYAGDTRPGQCVLVSEGGAGRTLRGGRLSRVSRVGVSERTGAFAPLTRHGTLVVDGVVASCYAVVDQHALAHRAFAPLRLVHGWTGSVGRHGNGIHWYSRLLHWLGKKLLDSGRLHPLGVAQGDR